MYAFIHIPKTAGSTVRQILRRSFGANHCDIKVPKHLRPTQPWASGKDLQTARFVYSNLKGICGHRVSAFGGIQDNCPDMQFFTFMRDPVDRFISHFQHLHRDRIEDCTEADLIRFCHDTKECNVQTRWICGTENAGEAIKMLNGTIGFVGLQEQFDASLVMLKHWLQMPELDISYHFQNRSKGTQPFAIRENPDLMQWVTGANQSDIELHQYVCDELFNRQIEQYASNLEQHVAHLQRSNKTAVNQREPLWSRMKRTLIYKPLLHIPG